MIDASAAEAVEVRALTERACTLLEEERRRSVLLEQRGEAMQRLLAMLAHDLRSPLNAMLGWADLLRRTPFDDVMRRSGLAAIERSAMKQAALIEDLLDIVQISEGKPRVDLALCDLCPIVRGVIDAFSPCAVAAKIDLVYDGPRSGVLTIADARRTDQIVTNLVTNALKFTSQGGRVEVRLESDRTWSRIVVADTGRGIAPGALPHVFEWANRGERGLEESSFAGVAGRGLGLGLYIVEQLALLQNGSVSAESPGEGRGATFTVRLCAARRLSSTRHSARRVSDTLMTPTLATA